MALALNVGLRCRAIPFVVMTGLGPVIHSVTFPRGTAVTEWIAGSNPAMTTRM
jgi:hypothetical protein